MLDNGAFTIWRKAGNPTDWNGYYWSGSSRGSTTSRHGRDPRRHRRRRGRERRLVASGRSDPTAARPSGTCTSRSTASAARNAGRVCFGSSGAVRATSAPAWQRRMAEAIDVACRHADGVPVRSHAARPRARRRPLPVRLGRQHERSSQPRRQGVTCPACFHDECATLGIHIHYTATVEQDGCADSDEVAIIPVPTADGGYYVWRARGGEGSASTRAQALRDGRAHLVALGDQNQTDGGT
jgi:hypothetical protein